MIIYLLNLFSLLIWKVVYNKISDKKKARTIVCSCITIQFILIQGLRSFEIGTDTSTYVSYYNDVLNNKNLSFSYFVLGDYSSFEIGYKFLIFVMARLGLSARVFIFANAVIINYFVSKYIAK